MMTKLRKGSMTLFLVIVIPVLIIGAFTVYRLLYARYLDEKALKIVSAVSEAHLSKYNEFLKKEYHLIAGLRIPLAESVDTYFSLNGYESSCESEFMTLDHPVHFRSMVVQSYLAEASRDLFESLTKKLGIHGVREGLSRKLKSLESGFETIASLIQIPSQLENLGKTRDFQMIRSRLSDLYRQVGENDAAFERHTSELLEGFEGLAEMKEQVTIGLSCAREKYEEVKTEVLSYAREVESLNELADRKFHEAESIHREIERLSEYLNGEGRSEDEIFAAKSRIEALQEELDAADRELQVAKSKLDQLLTQKMREIDKGGFYHLIKKIKKGLETLARIFHGGVPDGKQLRIQTDFRKNGMLEADSVSPATSSVEGLLQKLAVVEWCVGVMSSRVQDGSIEGRGIKGELEYIVSGKVREEDSLQSVKNKIVSLRILPNFVTWSQTDLKKQMDAFFAPVPAPFRLLAQTLGYGAAVLAESYHDADMLLKGKKLPFLKTKDEWAVTFKMLTSEENISSPEKILSSHEAKKEGLSYRDYIRILLFFQSEEDTVIRAMEAVEFTLDQRTEGKYGLKDFVSGHTIKVRYRFQSLFGNRGHLILYENSYR